MEKEKKKKIILCSSLITLVIVAVVVMLTGGMELRKNNNSNNIVERNLGDTTCTDWTPEGESWSCNNGTTYSTNGEPTSSTSGNVYYQITEVINNTQGCKMTTAGLDNCNACHKTKTWKRSCTDLQRAVITCKSPTPTYTGSSVVIATCSGGSIQNGNKVAPGNYAVSCVGDSTHTDAAITYCNLNCPAGSYKDGDNCKKCPLGYYNSGSSFTCTKCGAGMTTTLEGTTSSANCKKCGEGDYADRPYEVDGVCQATEPGKPKCELYLSPGSKTMHIGDLVSITATSSNCNLTYTKSLGDVGELGSEPTQGGKSIILSLWARKVGSGSITFKATSSDGSYTEETKTFNFNVQSNADSCDLTLEPSASSIGVGDNIVVVASSTKCTVSYTNQINSSVADVSVSTLNNAMKRSITITGKSVGSGSIVFTAEVPNSNSLSSVSKTFSLSVENKRCYCNLASGTSCTWGNMENNSAYVVQPNITSAAACTAFANSGTNACFKNSENKYVWGSYGANSGYTYVVASDKTSCEAKNGQTTEEDTYVLTCPSTTLSLSNGVKVEEGSEPTPETIMCTYLSSNDESIFNVSSTKPSVAVATKDGNYVKVTAKGAGTTKIYATTSNGKKTNEVSITVLALDSCKITSVTVNSQITSISKEGADIGDGKITKVDNIEYELANGGRATLEGGNFYSDINSYYIVFVDIEGTGCGAKDENGKNLITLSLEATNAKEITPNTAIGLNNNRKQQYAFHVYPKKACNTSRPTAKLSNGDEMKGNSVPLILNDWEPTSGCFDPTNKGIKCNGVDCYGSFLEADTAGADTAGKNVYYSDWNSTNKCYNLKWTRGGCDTGSSSNKTYACYANNSDITLATGTTWATSSSTTYPYSISVNKEDCKASACYVNSNKTDYQWVRVDKVPSGYTKATGILAKSDCKLETPACYIDANNIYHWGKYKTTIGYTLVPSVKNDGDCSAAGKCYKKDDDYIWSETKPEGYTEVENSQEECKPEEAPACYLYNGQYEWGNYATKTGYTLVGSIEEEQYCVKAVDACYLGPDNKYHVGDYSLDNDYTWVEESKCGSEIDVPKTALNISNIIYIAMALLAVFGIGFVYYANVKKQKNN